MTFGFLINSSLSVSIYLFATTLIFCYYEPPVRNPSQPPTPVKIIKKGFKVPTPIQRKTIPWILQGRDVVAMARTGSGKTAAFIVPIVERLKVHSAKVGARCVILSPSRELAMQTMKVVKELGRYTDLRAIMIVGGDRLEDQFTQMATNPDVYVHSLAHPLTRSLTHPPR